MCASTSRLTQSAYLSPYSRTGAPGPHPNGDQYGPLRASALSTLEAMGYHPQTMVEHSVLWAEHQDPFGHVMQSQFMVFMGTTLNRGMESYAEFLNEEECDAMVKGKTILPVIRKYEMSIRRQLIPASRQVRMEPTENHIVACLFSLKQQTIVAEVKGYCTYVDVKTARPIDIRTAGDNWVKLFDGFTRKSAEARKLNDKWESERQVSDKANNKSKI